MGIERVNKLELAKKSTFNLREVRTFLEFGFSLRSSSPSSSLRSSSVSFASSLRSFALSMTTPYAKLSELGEIDLTFDQEDAPETPKQKRRTAAEPTREELEIERRRRKVPPQRTKGRAPPPSRRRNPPPELEESEDGFEQPHFDPTSSHPGFDPNGWAPTQGAPPQNPGWTDVDNALYGGPMALPTQRQPPPPKKRGVEDYLPFAAGALILGTAAFFMIKAKSKGDGEGGTGGAAGTE